MVVVVVVVVVVAAVVVVVVVVIILSSIKPSWFFHLPTTPQGYTILLIQKLPGLQIPVE